MDDKVSLRWADHAGAHLEKYIDTLANGTPDSVRALSFFVDDDAAYALFCKHFPDHERGMRTVSAAVSATETQRRRPHN